MTITRGFQISWTLVYDFEKYEFPTVNHHSICCNWLNSLSFEVTDTDKKKGYIYVNEHERADVLAYREIFCKRWFDRYLSIRASYEGPKMVEISHKFAGHESKIAPVFHDESTFDVNEDQRYCRLEKDEQVLRPKSRGRRLMISKHV